MSTLKKELENLIEKKLVTVKKYPQDGLNVYKYSKAVFFKNLWHKSPYLLKARGLVLDDNGLIVQHPFDKVFNFNENGTGQDIALNKQVVAVEKLNGFLACITKHPNKNELLISTTGSLDSDFVKMIDELITPEQRKNMLSYFKDNSVTFMFEAIHPKDPHIISYNESEQGLWLIGARKKQENSKNYKEDVLDTIALDLGFRRPHWFIDSFENVLKKIKTDKIEGYMVLDNDKHNSLLKMKTNYYLTAKFLGRMGVNNITMMYENTDVFKDKVEEEFFELVDVLISKYSKDELLEMDNDKKVDIVKQLIEHLNIYRAENKFKLL